MSATKDQYEALFGHAAPSEAEGIDTFAEAYESRAEAAREEATHLQRDAAWHAAMVRRDRISGDIKCSPYEWHYLARQAADHAAAAREAVRNMHYLRRCAETLRAGEWPADWMR